MQTIKKTKDQLRAAWAANDPEIQKDRKAIERIIIDVITPQIDNNGCVDFSYIENKEYMKWENIHYLHRKFYRFNYQFRKDVMATVNRIIAKKMTENKYIVKCDSFGFEITTPEKEELFKKYLAAI